MAPVEGRVSLDGDGLFVVQRPVDADDRWWQRVCQQLSSVGDPGTSAVVVEQFQVQALTQQLTLRPAAAASWWWSTRARAARDARIATARRLRELAATPVDSQAVVDGLADELAASGFTRQLRGVQLEAVARLLAAHGGANFSVPGSGKTAVAYAVWALLRSRDQADALLVVAPQSSFEAWVEEAEVCFTPEHRPRITVRPHVVSVADDVVIVNYERLSDAGALAQLRSWMRTRPVAVAFDEAHRAKGGRRSHRGVAAAAIARQALLRMVLTGTPMPNRPSDLEAVFDLVWPGHGDRLVDGDLAERRERLFVRVTKADLRLPPMRLGVERVELEAPHRQLYEAMAQRVDAWASGPEVTAAEAGNALMRLIAATTNPAAVFAPEAPWGLRIEDVADHDLGEILEAPANHIRPAKIVRAAQLVAENRARGRKTLVWSAFVGNVAALTQALAQHQPATITGATPPDDSTAPTDRARELARFRTDPDCWALIATPQTLGEGVSLHHTCLDQVHVDRGYAAGTWLQAIDRTHRLGLPDDANASCTVVEAIGTIDQSVSQVLNRKVTAMAAALDDRSLRPLADPFVVPDDPVAAVLGDLNALDELLRLDPPRGVADDDRAAW